MRQCPRCGKRFLDDQIYQCDVDGSALQALVVTSAKDRLIGAVISRRYQIDGVLGDGGMGVVYRAKGLQDNRRYAIKVLRAEYSSEEDLVKRFQLEAETASAIKHPNIVQVYEFDSLEDQSRYFVMELLEGRSFGQLLAEQGKQPNSSRRKPLSDKMLLHISKQICEGLAAAHERGIVHRDMKPDNIHLIRMNNDPYFVKILDFGIAKVHGSKSARTRTGSVFGTPHYMSPEQASGERDIDARTDIYATGVLMYEMATGAVPFDADNLMGILTAHLYHKPKPPRSLPNVTISPELEAIILKTLSKRREARYSSMLELRDDLARIERGQPPQISKEELEAIYAPPRDSMLPPAPESADGVDDGRQTIPAGRVSAQNEAVRSRATQGTIPPVTAVAEPNGRRVGLLVGALAFVGVVSLGAAGVIVAKRAQMANAQIRSLGLPPNVTMPLNDLNGPNHPVVNNQGNASVGNGLGINAVNPLNPNPALSDAGVVPTNASPDAGVQEASDGGEVDNPRDNNPRPRGNPRRPNGNGNNSHPNTNTVPREIQDPWANQGTQRPGARPPHR